jgi:exosortase
MKLPAIPKVPIPFRHALSKSNLALTLKVATVTIVILALYHQDLTIIIGDALQSEATSYILAIPFIFAYLIYRKRRMLVSTVSFETSSQPETLKHLATLVGVLLCALAVILYWYGSYTFTPVEIHLLTLPVFAAGSVLIVFNPQTLRQLAFPILFLVFLTPISTDLLGWLGSTLSIANSEASSKLANTFGAQSVVSDRLGITVITLTRPDSATLNFSVGTSCSGFYPLVGFIVFALFLTYITRDKLWKKAAIFILGVPLIYLLSIIRLTTILLIGYHIGEQLAMQTFHLLGGFALIIIGTILVLAFSEKILRTKILSKTQPMKPCPTCSSVHSVDHCISCGRLLKNAKKKLRAADMAKLGAIAIAVILLMSIQAPVFALTQGPAEILMETPMGMQGKTSIFPQIAGYDLNYFSRDKSFEKAEGVDAALSYLYKPENQTGKSVLVNVEVAQTSSPLHPWEVCLITWPQTHGQNPSVTQLDLRDVQILANPPIVARFFAFQYTYNNQSQLVLYWFETSAFKINASAEQKHVEISLITFPDASSIAEEENRLLPIATAIAEYWQPVKTWTQIALAISQNGPALATVTASILAATLIFGIVQTRRNRKAKTNAYKKLSEPDQQLIEVVQQAGSISTLQNIAAAYQQTTVIAPNQDQLHERLTKAEEAGFIIKKIINRQDEPVQVWRATISRHQGN